MPLPHIQFDGAQSATTDYYPTNGAGGYDTGTAADSFVADYVETEIRRLIVPGSASGAQIIEFYHEDASLAFTTTVMAQTGLEDVAWAEGEGPVLRGAWTVQFPSVASATDFWFVQFGRVR